MATTYKSTFKRFNGTDWDTHYFKTSADVILETSTYKVLTATERTQISTYLTTFQTATVNDASVGNKLVMTNADGKIVSAQIAGGLPYLPLTGGTLTGGLTMSGSNSINTTLLTSSGTLGVSATGVLTLSNGTGNIVINPQGTLDVSSKRITSVANPTGANDAANKTYVDGLVSVGTRPAAGGPVKYASIGNVPTLSGLSNLDIYFGTGASTALAQGDRVLLWQQTTASQNGIYTISSTGWTKVTADSAQGILVFVEFGTYNDWLFHNTNGTVWAEFTKTDTITAGAGLTKNGTEISVPSSGITSTMLAGSIESGKLSNITPTQAIALGTIGAPVSDTYPNHLSKLYTALALAKGTTHWNTSPTRTMEAINTELNTKNRTYRGSAEPLNTGYISGDLYFVDIV